MLLQDDIRRLNLVSPVSQIRLKNSTCDLTVGEIFPADSAQLSRYPGTSSLEQFKLKPQNLINVTTEQKLNLPNNVTGLATLVTTMTQQGILCLNVGVVDPGYKGKLSATLVNFSNSDRTIKRGDRLFRVIFLDHRPLSDGEFEPFSRDNIDYCKDVWYKSKNEFDESFLGVNNLFDKARREAWKIVWTDVLRSWLPILAILISIASLAAQFFISD